MCLPNNIKLSLMVMNVFKAAGAGIFTWQGVTMAFNWDYQRAFATDIEGLAIGLLVTGVVSPFSTGCAYFGSRWHNKFLLTVHAFMDFTLFTVQLFMLSQIEDYAMPDSGYTPKEMAATCISISPIFTGGYPEECTDYYFSERYAKFHLAWIGKHSQANYGDADQYAEIIQNQVGGSCCGFGPPSRCIENENSYPSDVLTEGIDSSLLEAVTMCDAEISDDFKWYIASGTGTNECDHYIDPTVADPLPGGCEYDYPLGECMNRNPQVPGFGYQGCGQYFEEMLTNQLIDACGMMRMCSALAFISAFLACCHCWKRKERDILPHYTLEIPWDPDDPRNYKAKTKIMDEFDLEDEAAERKEEDGGDFE